MCACRPKRARARAAKGASLTDAHTRHTCAPLVLLLTHTTTPAGIYVIKGVGWVRDGAARREREERLTLRELGLQVGDYLDIMYVT